MKTDGKVKGHTGSRLRLILLLVEGIKVLKLLLELLEERHDGCTRSHSRCRISAWPNYSVDFVGFLLGRC